MSDSSSSSSVSFLKPESESNDSVTVSDNVVHHDSFTPFASSLPAPPPPPPSFQSNYNNINKPDVSKPDPTKVKKLAFNVITSLQEKVHTLESAMHGLRDKVDEDIEKFDEKYSDKYELINKKLGTTVTRLKNLGKNFLTLYNKFIRVEKIVDEEFIDVGSDEEVDGSEDENNEGIDDEEEEPILQPLLKKLNQQYKY
jgi:hypothetical protein